MDIFSVLSIKYVPKTKKANLEQIWGKVCQLYSLIHILIQQLRYNQLCVDITIPDKTQLNNSNKDYN